MAKKNKQTKLVINENLHQQINILSAQTKMTMQEWGNIFCQVGLSIVNQGREQGIEDKDIPDFLNVLEENAVFNDDIRHIAQNYIESKEN